MPTRIVIRHLSGSKVNQVDQFPIDSFPELTMGREPGATILFDAVRDDAVSRKHAVIRIAQGDPPNFKLSDLGSSNGTWLNGERIGGETELLPGDTIELGAGGPKLGFDVEPRPNSLVARTRMISAAGSASTRIIDTAGEAPYTAAASASTQTEPVTRASVGKNTVMRMLSEQRQATSRVGIYALAGILALIGIVGGLVYYKAQTDVAEQSSRLAEQSAKVQEQSIKLAEHNLKISQEERAIGLSPQEIVDKFGNATVLVKMQWRLYDRETGKPLFHKVFKIPTKDGGEIKLPGYVLLKGKLYRWLAIEDQDHQNYEVGSGGSGTGFVIGAQGLIATNKHVAAGWLINYNQFSKYEKGQGLIFEAQDRHLPAAQFSRELKRRMQVLDLTNEQALFRKLISWQPEDGGPVFANDQPVVIGNSDRTFEGRNEELWVRFPGSRVDVNARLVRASSDVDVALVQIDTTQTLATTSIADNDSVKVGERVTVLGYPGFSIENRAIFGTVENGEARRRIEVIPEPTVIPGSISKIGSASEQLGGVTIIGEMGNVYQMTVTSGPGNSGGPVFNAEGKVIGLFTYGSAREAVTYAVPIKYARDLIQMQRTF